MDAVSLGGPHDFRQTQTAIATWYFIHDGYALDYKIPCSWPELAFATRVSSLSGNRCQPPYGFLEHLSNQPAALFLSSFSMPVYRCWRAFFGSFGSTGWSSLVPLLLTLSTSTYIFYSRTFLIESLALFLSLLFVWSALRLLMRDGPPNRSDTLLFVSGILAVLVKVTTFSVGFGLILLLAGVYLLQANGFVERPWRLAF